MEEQRNARCRLARLNRDKSSERKDPSVSCPERRKFWSAAYVEIAELSRTHPGSSQSLSVATRKSRDRKCRERKLVVDMCSRALFQSTRLGDGLMQLRWLRSGIRKAKTVHKCADRQRLLRGRIETVICIVERCKLGKLATANEAKVQVQYPV
jgi:hypothetical protein